MSVFVVYGDGVENYRRNTYFSLSFYFRTVVDYEINTRREIVYDRFEPREWRRMVEMSIEKMNVQQCNNHLVQSVNICDVFERDFSALIKKSLRIHQIILNTVIAIVLNNLLNGGWRRRDKVCPHLCVFVFEIRFHLCFNLLFLIWQAHTIVECLKRMFFLV